MDIPKIHEGEYRFCLILWKHEPVTAAQLAKLCQEQLGWKRTSAAPRRCPRRQDLSDREPEKRERARHRVGLPG